MGSWSTAAVFVRDAAVDDMASAAGSTGCGHPPGKSGLDERGCWLTRIPPFRKASVRSVNAMIVQELRTSLIGGLGAPQRRETPWPAP